VNILPLLATISLTGCATSIEELMVDAEECVDDTRNVSVQGIVTKPSDDQKQACWADVNERLELEMKREKQRSEEAVGTCPNGRVMVCDMSWGDKRCGCMDSWRVRQMLGGY